MAADNRFKKNICTKCGKPFAGSPGQTVCKSCAEKSNPYVIPARLQLSDKDSQKMQSVRDYIRDNPGVTGSEVMNAVGISNKFLQKALMTGIFVGKRGEKYPCENCGKIITSGVYCNDCLVILRNEARHHREIMEGMKARELSRKAKDENAINILVADGDGIDLNITKVILEKGLENCNVFPSKNLNEVMYNAGLFNMSLILLDDGITKTFDGFEILRQIRTDENLRNVPVIMLSSGVKQENRAKALALGVPEYISKPFNAKNFIEKIKEYLSSAKKFEYTPVELIKILLIEDNAEHAKIETERLQSVFNCEIILMPSGPEGLGFLKNNDVDVIFVSYDLPFMNGTEFLNFVRNTESLKRFPVVIITDSTDMNILRKITSAAASGYLRKPDFSQDGLMMIKEIIDFHK